METDGVDLEEKEAAGGGERTTSPNSPCRLASRSAPGFTHAWGALMRKARMRVLMREGWGKAPPRARDRARNPARTPLVETIKGRGRAPKLSNERPAR